MSKSETDKFGLIDRGDMHDFMAEVQAPSAQPEALTPQQETTEGFVRLVDFIKRKKRPTAHNSMRAVAISRYRAQRDLYPAQALDYESAAFPQIGDSVIEESSGPIADGAEVLEDSIKS